MPMVDGYSIYVAPTTPRGAKDLGEQWIVRVYRDSDDIHIHSAEGAPLEVGMDEAIRAIARDVHRPTIPEPPTPTAYEGFAAIMSDVDPETFGSSTSPRIQASTEDHDG